MCYAYGRLAVIGNQRLTVAEIPLTQGQTALVDVEDFERVSMFSWYAGKRANIWYAFSDGPGKTTGMHRFIMNASDEEEVDHVDHDGLNNCKNNLRKCTHRQNMHNNRGRKRYTFKGVSYHDGARKYRARITKNGKQIHLGFFVDSTEAAKAYDAAAKELFGEYAQTNF